MQAYLAEFIGTMILIILGDGVVAGVLLKNSKAENSGWIVITFGWAMAVDTDAARQTLRAGIRRRTHMPRTIQHRRPRRHRRPHRRAAVPWTCCCQWSPSPVLSAPKRIRFHQ